MKSLRLTTRVGLVSVPASLGDAYVDHNLVPEVPTEVPRVPDVASKRALMCNRCKSRDAYINQPIMSVTSSARKQPLNPLNLFRALPSKGLCGK